MRALRIAFIGLILTTLFLASLAWYHPPSGWSREVQVTDSPGDTRLVDVLADPAGAIVHLVWEDNRYGTMQVFYQRSLNDGVTWEKEVQLTQSTSNVVDPMPRLVSSGKTIFVFFSNQTESGVHLFYVSSSNQGSNFDSPRPFTLDLGYQANVAVAAVARNVHVVWQNYLNGNEHIYYSRSLDSGSSWQPEMEITSAGGMDRHPAISAVDGKVFVVWSRLSNDGSEAIFFRASYNDGETWGDEEQISAPEAPVFQAFPSVASDGVVVHTVWNGQAVMYARSNDNGTTWDQPITVTNTTRQYLAPRIAVEGSNVRVVTAAISTESVGRVIHVSSDVFVLESTDTGVHWSQPFSLTSHPSRVLSLAPSVSILNGATFFAWQDNRNGSFGVFFASKPDFTLVSAYENRLIAVASSIVGTASLFYLVFEVGHRKSRRRRTARRRSPLRRGRRARQVRE
jgi:hypothetical protein